MKDAGELMREAVTAWPGVTAVSHRFGGTEYRYGKKEMGHVQTMQSVIGGGLEHALARCRSTLVPHGSPATQLRNHLRSVRKLMVDEPELGIVMGELALRSARDRSIEKMFNQTRDLWQTAM